MDALIEGLNDGTIDAIVSQHTPHEIEFKDVEFEVAEFGMIGLQTALPLVAKAGLSNELIVQKMAVGPRTILNLEIPVITVGEPANLVIFDTTTAWEYNLKNNRSKSYNSPFLGQVLQGKVFLTINNNQFYK